MKPLSWLDISQLPFRAVPIRESALYLLSPATWIKSWSTARRSPLVNPLRRANPHLGIISPAARELPSYAPPQRRLHSNHYGNPQAVPPLPIPQHKSSKHGGEPRSYGLAPRLGFGDAAGGAGGIMKCHRCNGLMYRMELRDTRGFDRLTAFVCIICGEILDSTIAVNRGRDMSMEQRFPKRAPRRRRFGAKFERFAAGNDRSGYARGAEQF